MTMNYMFMITRDAIRDMVDNLFDPLILFNVKGRISYVNKPIEELCGDRLVGSPLLRLFPKREVKRIQKLIKKVTREGAPIRDFNTFFLTKKGGEIPVKISSRPLRDDKRRIEGGLMVIKDANKRTDPSLRRHCLIDKK